LLDIIEMLGQSGYDFRSSVVLTYSLDMPLYDGLIRRALNRAGIWNQIVFCDFSCYLQNIESQTAALYVGKHYSLTPLWQSAAFHPKIYMMLGPRHGRVFVGSGNATVGGLIRNAEVFGLFDFDAEKVQKPHAIFRLMFEFIEELGKRASDTVRTQIKTARQMAPWLSSPAATDGRTLLIGGPGKPGLLTQILAQLPTKMADDLVICSSSFDRDLAGLKLLSSLSKARPICIVQPEHVEIDGSSVRELKGMIDWRSFADPYPPEKLKRRDVRAHAKILIFGHGKTETCVFGSANASRAALNSKNTEAVVILRGRPRGATLKQLGLDASVKTRNPWEELSKKHWDDSQDERPESGFSCLLSAVTATQSGFRLSLALGELPKASLLALSSSNLGRPRFTLSIHQEEGSAVAQSAKNNEPIRFAWIVTKSGKPLSNAIAITWHSVASPRRTGRAGTKADNYLSAMQDGSVLGTILFELLDQFRDFEVIRVKSGGRVAARHEPSGHESGDVEHLPEFFYTDSKADEIDAHHWIGDRIDLDILASLVQPLTSVGMPRQSEDEDDVYDDSKLDEEAERRQIEAKKGRATGEERQPVLLPPSKKLETAIKRLERRLNRAAASIEDSLRYLENLESLKPNGIARQVWMTHIGAFLVNRMTESEDGEEFVCLRPWCFADYVLRVCRALVGSKKVGGFLDKLTKSSWEGFDGDALKKGLSFLWTCVSWAAAYMTFYYSTGEGKAEVPNSIAVAAAELVAARFIFKVGAVCKQPDHEDLQRRFPAWSAVPRVQVEQTSRRLQQIVELITAVEGEGNRILLGSESAAATLKAGALVHNPKLGVTMLAMDGDCGSYLVDLSHSGDLPVKFAALVAPVLLNGKPYELFQRTEALAAA
jgi:HKD family nuclease